MDDSAITIGQAAVHVGRIAPAARREASEEERAALTAAQAEGGPGSASAAEVERRWRQATRRQAFLEALPAALLELADFLDAERGDAEAKARAFVDRVRALDAEHPEP